MFCSIYADIERDVEMWLSEPLFIRPRAIRPKPKFTVNHGTHTHQKETKVSDDARVINNAVPAQRLSLGM
jgi:hypothetical protein